MEFIFYTYANDGCELVTKAAATLAPFFPASKWTYCVTRVEQVKQEPITQKRFFFFKIVKQPTQVLFQVTAEVFSNGLNNTLVQIKSLEKK